MASAAGIRMGKVFVEIGGDASKLFRTLSTLNKRIGQAGAQMRNVGSRVAGVGLALAAPLGAAAASATRFDDVLRNMQASAGVAGADLDRARAAAMSLSEALGVGPTQAAQGILALLKAGMSLDQVLGGGAEAAIQFAKVGEMAVGDAAEIMADAMNVFGVTAQQAADALSQAADASSTDIAGISQAFAQVSAVAALANQSIESTSAALAVLANAGIKGSDAGTSLKTMLMRLSAPADDAVAALADIGLNVDSFRNADGTMKPLVDIIGVLETSLAGMDQAARDDIFRRIFGSDAIRAAAVLTQTGSDGFAEMQQSMQGANSIGDKFRQLTGGMSGSMGRLYAALERVAIAVGEAIGPSLQRMVDGFVQAANMVAKFISENQSLVVTVAGVVAGVIAAGVAIWGLGAAMSAVSAIGGVVLAVIGALASPIGLVVAAFAALSAGALYAVGAFDGLAANFSGTLSGIYDAITAGDLSMAFEILWAGLHLSWLQGVATFMGFVDPWISMFQNAFTYLGTEIAVIWDRMTTYLASTQWGAALIGVFDNVINQILWSWDQMESALRKSWNLVQSFFRTGFDLTAENNKVDSEMAARAQARSVARPGVTERMRQASEEGDRMRAEGEQRVGAMRQAADETMQGREDANRERAAERAAGVAEAQQRLDELRGRAAEAAAVTQARKEEEMKALQGVQEAARPGPARAPEPEAAGAGEVVGTFSALAAAGLGFGSTLDQQMVDELKRVNRNLETMEGGVIAE